MEKIIPHIQAGQPGSCNSLLWLFRHRSEKNLLFLLLFLFACTAAESQTISGTFPQLTGEEIRLEGFNGFETNLISTTDISDEGIFTLDYSQAGYGMGQLVSEDGNSFIVILSGEEIEVQGKSFAQPETIEVVKGKENRLFEQYASEHPRREQTLSAWIYLENIYRSDSLFAAHDEARQSIAEEKQRIRDEDEAFLAGLDPQMYVSWYLPARKLVNSVPVVAQYRAEEIPQTVKAFRQLDYTDERLYNSGLLADVIESHVWLIENSGRSLDSVFVELNKSIDEMLENLSQDENKFNEVSEYLFDLLEQRSLFTSAEYLALSFLEGYPELLSSRLADKLEIYRAMKVGNTAPDIVFTENTLLPNGITATRMSEIDAEYILVVFAAGWCPHCREMMPELAEKSQSWREQGVKVVLVSLDDSPKDFEQFASDLPFISTTDFQRWDSPIAQSYHVHSIPAMVLLDSSREILLHPNSVQHMDAWIGTLCKTTGKILM